jgi:subtilase family serine protease
MRLINCAVAICSILGLTSVFAFAEAQNFEFASRPMISQPVVESDLTPLFGNVRPEANAVSDRGRAADALPLQHMILQLRRPPIMERAFERLVEELHDPNSRNFHRWLSANEVGARFGPAQSDIRAVESWLRGHGFIVNVVYPSRMWIDFSGTAGQIFSAFHTEIHNLQVNGASHIANMSDPKVPTALAPVIVGIVSLHDFFPHPAFTVPQQNTATNCNLSGFITPNCYQVAPEDLARIYDFWPVFNAGVSGQGQTIYLIEDGNLNPTSWTYFRSLFGLSQRFPSGSLKTINPPPPTLPSNCLNPSTTNYSSETTLDAEWASAAAPNAAIVIASCAQQVGSNSLLIALLNVFHQPKTPAVVSISYGECEAYSGAVVNQAFVEAYKMGAAGGTSIFVSAGDQGAAKCDDATLATHGIGVNAYASTIYNVAVGGADFADTYMGSNSTYWNSTNTQYFGSAKSYIPEIPWNATCGSMLVAAKKGFATTFGPSGFCNSTEATTTLLNAGPWAGGGGPSGCATGTPQTPLVVGGTCKGWPKPRWQSGVLGNPADGVRDLPDVSLFTARSPWGHSYVVCDIPADGTPCVDPSNHAPNQATGGTSASTPIMAGIQALINQYTGRRHGNPNYRIYELARKEYGASGNSSCNSSLGNKIGSSCIFHDVTLGDSDRPCTGSNNCFNPGGDYGVMSTSNTAYAPSFSAAKGWDFATGIGTVSVYNLVRSWKPRRFYKN